MGELVQPGYLALLLALPLVWALSRKSLANLSPARARLAMGLRIAMLTALALALAGPRGLLADRQPNLLFLMDESPSVAEAGRAAAAEFVAEAEGKRPVGRSWAVGQFSESLEFIRDFTGRAVQEIKPPGEASRLSRALELGAALLPPGPGRIVVLSDGLSTDGLPAPEQLGREVDVVVLPVDSRPDARVERILVPPEIRTGEGFNATVIVGSNTEGMAVVELFQDGFRVGRQEVQLAGKSQSVVFPNLQPKSTDVRLEAAVIWSADSQPQNDRLTTRIAARGKSRVLLIDPDPEQLSPLAGAFGRAEMEAEIRPPEAFPANLAELSGFEVVILSNVAAKRLRSDQVAGLRSWVQDFGGGLIVTGGPDSLGAGGYFRTPLEDLLPVWSEHPDKLELPVSALEVILDRSGSMTAVVGGQTKMDLANLGAIGALEALQNRDYFGLMAVDVRPQIVLPLGPIGDRALAQRAIRGIRSAGGGIYVYSALEEAYRQLRSVPAKIKHVIVFADAADAEEKSGQNGQTSADLAIVALGNKITTSIVALGNESDKDVGFLRTLAQSGNGRFYLTNDATALPQIFARETLRATQSSLVEEAFLPEAGRSPVLAGMDWASAPPLLGYNAVRPKPGAESMMFASGGDPLLVRWPLGLGNVAVFTSDATSRWAAEWLAWPGFGKFWTQLARSLARKQPPGDFELELAERAGQIELRIHSEKRDAHFAVQGVMSDGTMATPEVQAVAPGEFRAEFPIGEAAGLGISVRSTPGTVSARTVYWDRRYPDEFSAAGGGAPLLKELADRSGGRVNPTAADVWRPLAEPVFRPFDLAPFFLALALLLFLADLANRRGIREKPPAENPLAAP